ncbi:hypothetical protein ABUE31_03430 [Mesorhizobium sp. ZMM04-5]|uniref:7-cyano-7-deazaguanine synthase n=1 Tax=Mesorhizobium marinum TaxID=3228790 RepID=A0ABV3QVD8_9HYPH
MIDFRLEKKGDAISIVGGGHEIVFEMSDACSSIENDAIFAAWAVLPIGMRLNRRLIIDGFGDDVAAANATSLSRTWSTWLPARFSPVDLEFKHQAAPRSTSDVDLVLYSGGVDSCYHIMRRHRAGKRQAIVTMHGSGFEDEAFKTLVAKTAGFAEAYATKRMTVRTDIRRVYRDLGMTSDVTHGFALAATLFLMRSNYCSGSISADYSRTQEFLVFPWGTNSVTNAFFESTDFRMETRDLDVTRAEKLELISGDEIALRSLSFCTDRAARPHNCGRCTKCVRTKAMFLAALGDIPDIFIDRTMGCGIFDSINLARRSEVAFAVDLIAMARQRGTANLIPELDNLERRVRNSDPSPPGKRGILKRSGKFLGALVGAIVHKLTGSPGVDAIAPLLA